MVRYLFTSEIGLVDKGVHDKLNALGSALRLEFPAFHVAQTVVCDRATAIVVDDSDAGAPVEAWNRLDGWGHGELTLELVK